MNVDIGTEAPQFPETEYINGIIVAVWNEDDSIFLSDLWIICQSSSCLACVYNCIVQCTCVEFLHCS
jgi:hypothetical protein